MFKNSYKLVFFCSMVLGSLISISSTSWLSLWMGLEINLLSFIPLMMMKKNLFSSESSLKYFLIQALASSTLLFSFMVFSMFLNAKTDLSSSFTLLISSNLLLKMGAAPFHFWLPSVMEGLMWQMNVIILTWQKIAPIVILSYCLNVYLLMMSIILSLIFGSLGGLNQTSLRKLMAFSSINHLGWMMSSMLYNEKLWLIYFMFYCFLSISVILIFQKMNIFNLNQTFSSFYSNIFMKLSMILNLLSLGGLPPFLGFFPKWLIIEMLIKMNNYFLLMIMLMLTLVTLYFYLRICYSALLMNFYSMNWNFKMNYSLKSKMLFFFTFLTMTGLIMINFIFLFI